MFELFYVTILSVMLVSAFRMMSQGWRDIDFVEKRKPFGGHPEMKDVEPGDELMGVVFGEDLNADLKKRIRQLQQEVKEDDNEDDDGDDGLGSKVPALV
jgi:hypothetical protein